jgi:hypothetical protein
VRTESSAELDQWAVDTCRQRLAAPLSTANRNGASGSAKRAVEYALLIHRTCEYSLPVGGQERALYLERLRLELPHVSPDEILQALVPFSPSHPHLPRKRAAGPPPRSRKLGAIR